MGILSMKKCKQKYSDLRTVYCLVKCQKQKLYTVQMKIKTLDLGNKNKMYKDEHEHQCSPISFYKKVATWLQKLVLDRLYQIKSKFLYSLINIICY
jgi:hypothetical protein